MSKSQNEKQLDRREYDKKTGLYSYYEHGKLRLITRVKWNYWWVNGIGQLSGCKLPSDCPVDKHICY